MNPFLYLGGLITVGYYAYYLYHDRKNLINLLEAKQSELILINQKHELILANKYIEWIETATQNIHDVTKRGYCIICFRENAAIYAAVPCGHSSLCGECVQIIRSAAKCPMCRHE